MTTTDKGCCLFCKLLAFSPLGCSNPACECHKEKARCATSSLCSHNTDGRDLNEPCSIGWQPFSDDRGWVKTLKSIGLSAETSHNNIVMQTFDTYILRGFISSLLQQERAKAREEALLNMAANFPEFSMAVAKGKKEVLAAVEEWVKENAESDEWGPEGKYLTLINLHDFLSTLK